MDNIIKKIIKESIRKYLNEENSLNNNFWKWFGSSKIIENGNPMICYHGSRNSDIEVFDKSWIGLTDEGFYGIGFYFTNDLDYAKEYGKNIYPCYLNCKNPFRLIYVNSTGDDDLFDLRDQLSNLKGIKLPYLKTNRKLPKGYFVKKYTDNYSKKELFYVSPIEKLWGTDKEIYGPDSITELSAIVRFNDMLNDVDYYNLVTFHLINRIGKREFTNIVRSNGYDCVIPSRKNNETDFSEICVFEPNQIKSIDNDGSWDINDNNIYS
jgi:hypothetical protein